MLGNVCGNYLPNDQHGRLKIGSALAYCFESTVLMMRRFCASSLHRREAMRP